MKYKDNNNNIQEVRAFIDEKIVKSINKDSIDILEYQYILEKIDKMLEDMEKGFRDK